VSRGGIGVGSASIVLVFAVLCLTIFSLITFVVANNERSIVDAKVNLVTGYYEADALAEQILVDLVAADIVPSSLHGVEILTRWNEELGVDTTYYYCQISPVKSLYVNLVIRDDSFDILSWRMRDTDIWTFDDSINVWSGDIEE